MSPHLFVQSCRLGNGQYVRTYLNRIYQFGYFYPSICDLFRRKKTHHQILTEHPELLQGAKACVLSNQYGLFWYLINKCHFEAHHIYHFMILAIDHCAWDIISYLIINRQEFSFKKDVKGLMLCILDKAIRHKKMTLILTISHHYTNFATYFNVNGECHDRLWYWRNPQVSNTNWYQSIFQEPYLTTFSEYLQRATFFTNQQRMERQVVYALEKHLKTQTCVEWCFAQNFLPILEQHRKSQQCVILLCLKHMDPCMVKNIICQYVSYLRYPYKLDDWEIPLVRC